MVFSSLRSTERKGHGIGRQVLENGSAERPKGSWQCREHRGKQQRVHRFNILGVCRGVRRSRLRGVTSWVSFRWLVRKQAVGWLRMFSFCCWRGVSFVLLAAATSPLFFSVGDGHDVGTTPSRGPGFGGGGSAPSFMQGFDFLLPSRLREVGTLLYSFFLPVLGFSGYARRVLCAALHGALAGLFIVSRTHPRRRWAARLGTMLIFSAGVKTKRLKKIVNSRKKSATIFFSQLGQKSIAGTIRGIFSLSRRDGDCVRFFRWKTHLR